MKKTIGFMIALFATVTLFAGGRIESHCYPADGTIWTFTIVTDATDQWDSSKNENPPLSPKKAKELATVFMKRVPLSPKMKAWTVSTITLRKMSGDQVPEHWIYEVHFDGVVRNNDWNGPLPWFTVPVRMDGTIPRPKIKKRKKEK